MNSFGKAALLAATALAPGSALAQAKLPPRSSTAPQSDAEVSQKSDKTGAGLNDIIVTARRVSESLQDVPQAVTAFDAEDIKADRINDLANVAKLTSGLNYTPLFGRQNQLPIIRGAAQTFGELNVGAFIDGIYLSGKAGIDLELSQLQRIEVVKGPQSALYGRNTFAGAINYVTKRPTAQPSGHAEATIGTNNLYKLEATVSGPLTSELRARLGGYHKHFDGFYRSGIDGGKVDFEENWGTLAELEWLPTDQFSARLRFSYAKDDDGQPPSSAFPTNTAPGTPPGSAISGQFEPTRNLLYKGELPDLSEDNVLVNTTPVPGLPSPYGDREERIRGSAILKYDFANMELTSITAYAKRNYDYTFDGDNNICLRTGGCPSFGFPFVPAIPEGTTNYALASSTGYYRDISQELRLSSSNNETFDWQAGLYYYDNINVGIDRGYGVIPPGYDSFNPDYTRPRNRQTTKSYSAYGSLTYHATNKLSLTGALRYEYEKKTFTQSPEDPDAGNGSTARFDLDKGFDFVTPRVIVDYQIDPDKLVYASYARGAKTGGFNTGLSVFADQRTYNPEYANNYEIGFKSDLLDNHLRFNVDGYYIDWNNEQVPCQNPVTVGGTSTQRTYLCNRGASTIYGVEVETAARLSDHFTITANYSWTHSRYDRFVDASLASTLDQLGLPPIDFDGKHMPYVPDHKFVISPQYTVTVGDVRLEARGDIQYQNKSYLRAANFQYFGDRTSVDLRLTGHLDRFRAQLFVNNLFDNKTAVAGVRFYDAFNYAVAAPLVTGPPRREIGLTLGYDF